MLTLITLIITPYAAAPRHADAMPLHAAMPVCYAAAITYFTLPLILLMLPLRYATPYISPRRRLLSCLMLT